MQYFQLDPPIQIRAGFRDENQERPFYFDCATCDAKEPPIAGVLASDDAGAGGQLAFDKVGIVSDPEGTPNPRGPRHAVFCAACFAKQISPPDVGTPDTQQQQTTETETTMNATAPAPTRAPAAPAAPSAPTAPTTRTVLFTKELDRKNAVRFQEVATEGVAPVCGTLYLQKWFCRAAQNVRVTIELV